MADAVELSILIKAVDSATDVLKQIEQNTAKLGDAAARAADQTGLLGSALHGLELGAGIAGFEGLAASMEGVATSASKFQAEMVNIQNNTGMTAKQTEVMSQNILQMSSAFGVATDQIGEGFKHVQNITQDAAASQVIMNNALESAASTGANVGAVANVLAGTLHEYGLDAVRAADGTTDLAAVQQNAVHAMGVMHLAAQMSNVDLGQWTAALSTSIGIASGMHQPLEDIGAMFASLSKHGFPDAAAAGTQIQDLFAHLIHLTPQASGALAELAKVSGIDLAGSLKGLNEGSVTVVDFLGQMRDAMLKSGLTTEEFRQEIFKIIPAMRGGFGAAALLTTGFDDMNTTLSALNDQQKVNEVTEAGWQVTLGTTQKQWEILTNTLHNFGITAGTELMPSIQPFLAAINERLPAGLKLASDAMSGLGDAIKPLGMLVSGLAGVFSETFGGILDVVTTVGQAIYQGLQWINPFASHSPPLVSQVQDGVAAISAAYDSLGGITSTFDGIGTAFESLAGKTSDFSNSVDGLSIKTEKALAVLGPGITAAFNEASSALANEKAGLADIKQAWDDAAFALIPLKDNLDATKDALKDQQDMLSGLKLQLSDAKSVFDPLNQALKDATQDAKDADAAIKNLTNVPLQGSAEFTKKISDANIAIKQQALVLSDIKNSSAYTSLSDQIDAATEKLKAMQRSQSAAPTVVAGTSASQRAAVAEANNAARAAISQQQAALDVLKNKQSDMLVPVQRKLDLDKNALEMINLQKDATIGVAQEQIKQAAAVANGIKEQTQAQIEAGIAAAGTAKAAANAQVDTLTPQVAAQQVVMDTLTAKIRDQEHAVADAKTTSDAANETYTAAKAKVDDLGTAYRTTKQEIANYEAQLKSTITTGDTQVQKIAAAEKAAKAAAKAAAGGSLLGGPPVTPPLTQAVSSVSNAAAETSHAVDTVTKPFANMVGPIKAFADSIMTGATALGTFLAPLSGLGHWLATAALAFVAFSLAAGPVGVLLTALGAGLAILLSPLGLTVLAVAALGTAIATNFGGIRQILQPAIDAFAELAPEMENFGTVLQKALGGDVSGAIDTFESIIGAVADKIGPIIDGWAKAFIDWAGPLIPVLTSQLSQVSVTVIDWITKAGVQIIKTVSLWGTAFIGWVLPHIPQLLNLLETLARSMFDWVKAVVPRIIDAFGQWGTAFIAWVLPLLPEFLTALEGIANQVLAWIRDSVPALLGAFADWASAFIGWVAPMVPPILGELAALAGEIVRWAVEEALPMIAGTLGDWGKAFIEWIAPRIQPMLEELAGIADALAKWILDRLPEIVAEVEKWGASFVNWIGTTVLPALAPALDTIINGGEGFVGIVPWIKAAVAAFPAAFAFWVTAFVLWVDDVVKSLPDTLAKIPAAIADWVKSDGATAVGESAKPLGQALLDGIIAGLKIGVPGFYQAIGDTIISNALNLAPQIQKGIQDALTQHSGTSAPSSPASTGTPGGDFRIPTASDIIPGPVNIGAGTNIAKGAAPISDAQFGSAIKAMGFTANEIASICGPIAAEGMAQALTGAVVDLPKLVRSSEAAGLGAFSTDVGTFGNAGEIGILKKAGVDATTVSAAEAEALAAQGIPVIINTAKHFWAAQGYDANTGKFDVGNTNVFPKATGGGRNLTLSQISGAGGGVQGFIAPTAAATASLRRSAAPAASAMAAASDALDTLSPVGRDIPKGIGDELNNLTLTAQDFAAKFGISMTSASKILTDQGSVAKTILGTDVPDNFSVTDKAVEQFADSFGVSWDQARDILTAGGDVANAVMGKQIPSAAQDTIDAVGSVGNKALWGMISDNAAATGRDLGKYLKDIGAPAINLATASLDQLQKASGLTLPQVQAQAGAAGKDIRTWLLTVGVPAAEALSKSMGVDGLAGAAIGLKEPIGSVTGAASSMAKDGLDVAKMSVGDLGGKMGEVATNQATQIAAVLLDLRDGLLGIGKHSEGGGLIKAVKDFTDALGNIHDITVTITTDYVSKGTPSAAGSAGGGGSSSSDSGASGPGGIFAQQRQNAANAARAAAVSNPKTISDAASMSQQAAAQGGILSNPSGLHGTGGFASGGAFTPGKPYMVGERGMEIITPSHAGMVHHVGASKMIAEALSNWPSSETVNHTVKALDHIQAQFNALPKSVQVKATVQATSASPAAGFQQGYQPRPAGAASSAGNASNKLSQQDAQMIANELAKALHSNPPVVSVEQIRSKLISIGAQNGGYVGLA